MLPADDAFGCLQVHSGSVTGDGDALHWLEYFARQPVTTSGEVLEFGELRIAFLRPLAGSGGVATGSTLLKQSCPVCTQTMQTEREIQFHGLEDSTCRKASLAGRKNLQVLIRLK